ncbi:MAG TPA: decaprenylphospho-beta-D-erythro-pentofuranosid-2-ulose 2-reductase [Acidimicrobiales bacterium]|nr:decaprenylphospho-beta-D-erythro-pentofuranosid-2-ulose 2-reductase [Acidimicrobiales bacterium]
MNDALGQPQSVLVLGGGSEIARALLPRLTRAERVVLTGRPGSPTVATAAAEAGARGATVRTLEMDATDPSSVVAAVDAAFDGEGGDIDLVVVAFGVLGDQAAAEDDPRRAIEVATVDYTSQVVAGLAAARRLRGQGHGTIVALSSVAGERVRRANFVYGSTKAGMDGFFQGLGDSLVGTGVRVMIVRPGFVKGRMTAGMGPAPLATDPAAVAEAIVAGLARADDVIYVPPMLRHVFRVLRHLPRAAWRKVPR